MMKKEREKEISDNISYIEHFYNYYFTKEKVEASYRDLKNNKNAYLKILRKRENTFYDIGSLDIGMNFLIAFCCALVFAILSSLFPLGIIPYIDALVIFISSIFMGSRCASKLLIKILSFKSAKQKYYECEQVLTNALSFINREEEKNIVKKVQLNDNFLEEIVDTINAIKVNSYPSCKEELISLQELSEEYLKYQDESTNFVLTLGNKQEELKNRLKNIKEKIKSEQSKYRIAHSIEKLDSLIYDKNNQNEDDNTPVYYKIEEDQLKENINIKYLGSLEIANDLNAGSKRNLYAKESSKIYLNNILNRIKHHKLLYSILSYFHKIEEKKMNSCPADELGRIDIQISLFQIAIYMVVYTISHLITGNIPLSLFLSLSSCYLPPIIKGNKTLKDVYVPNLKDRIAEIKEGKSSKGKEETRVDSFIKDIMQNIAYIQNNPYKDCEEDIADLKQLATDYVEYIHRSPNYKPNLELNAETKDFYGREYTIESSFSKKQNTSEKVLTINKSIKDALKNPSVDNSIIEKDMFIKDIIKVINMIKNNDYEHSSIDQEQVRDIAVDYINFVYNRPNKLSYREINIALKNYYQRLLTLIDVIKNKQKVSDNITEIDSIITEIDRIKLDTDLDLDVNKLDLKLK